MGNKDRYSVAERQKNSSQERVERNMVSKAVRLNASNTLGSSTMDLLAIKK